MITSPFFFEGEHLEQAQSPNKLADTYQPQKAKPQVPIWLIKNI